MKARIRAFFLVGPTASGKSEVAQRVAERRGWEILSADSMLVYRGMDIGTAKPTPAEQRRVPYHGMDLTTPDRPFSVWDYREAALEVLRRAADRGCGILVVGGTGLYVKSLTDGLAAIPASDPARRAYWQDVCRREGLAALRGELRRRDPTAWAALGDEASERRVIRCLERLEAGAAAKPRTWRDPGVAGSAPLAGLRMPAEDLARRIRERVEAMYRAGLVREAVGLREAYGELSVTARQAIGYAEAFDVADGRCGEPEAIEKTVLRTRRLAKRQRTWFRHQARVSWVETDPGGRIEDEARRLEEIWDRYGPADIQET